MTEAPVPTLWAYVEVMGHNKVAGRVSEVNFAGKVMLSVDIPVSDTEFFTRYYSGDSIFSVTFGSEAEIRKVATYLKEKPLPLYMLAEKVALPAPRFDPDLDDYSDDDYDGWDEDDEELPSTSRSILGDDDGLSLCPNCGDSYVPRGFSLCNACSKQQQIDNDPNPL